MPLYLDRHNLSQVSALEVAHAHALDLAIQHKHGVSCRTYWFDTRTRFAFCLIDAPSVEAAIRVHKESHGLLPTEVIEVDPVMVEAFLGRLTDPAATTANGEPISESGQRVVMFTDIVNSTEMTSRLGDARATDLVRSHDAIVRREIEAVGGRQVKHLGDGIMAAFAEPDRSVACACAIQRGVAAFNGVSSDALCLRIGLHAGEPVEDNSDLFGATVQLASRICADAPLDAVVISDVLQAALETRFAVTPLGRRMYKGFKDPVAVFSVEWRA